MVEQRLEQIMFGGEKFPTHEAEEQEEDGNL